MNYELIGDQNCFVDVERTDLSIADEGNFSTWNGKDIFTSIQMEIRAQAQAQASCETVGPFLKSVISTMETTEISVHNALLELIRELIDLIFNTDVLDDVDDIDIIEVLKYLLTILHQNACTTLQFGPRKQHEFLANPETTQVLQTDIVKNMATLPLRIIRGWLLHGKKKTVRNELLELMVAHPLFCSDTLLSTLVYMGMLPYDTEVQNVSNLLKIILCNDNEWSTYGHLLQVATKLHTAIKDIRDI